MDIRNYMKLMDVLENLKNQTRHSWTSNGRLESVAEHSWRLVTMAYFVKDEFPEADMDKIMLMCLFHDIGEIFTGDIPAFVKTKADGKVEEQRVGQWLQTLPEPYQTELTALFQEMNRMESPEAHIYKALDRMEAVIQHNEADISTWLPLEYDLQMTYGEKETGYAPYLQKLKQEANRISREKIKGQKEQSQ